VSAAFSSIAVVIAFLALIWVTNSWKRPDAYLPIWDGCSTTFATTSRPT
jgi:hypothetical protein